MCWGDAYINVTASQPDRLQVNYPVSFTALPAVTIQVVENGYNVQPVLYAWGMTNDHFYALNRGSKPSSHIFFRWVAVGKWK